MSHCELEAVTQHINDRIVAIRRVLELRIIAKDVEKGPILRKIGQGIVATDGLLDQFEKCIGRQRDLLTHLKELEEFFKEDVRNGKHLKDNMPTHMPRKGQPLVIGEAPALCQTGPVDTPPSQPENPRKTSKNHIREMPFITITEFENIPQYMKGRMSFDQLNAAVQSLNSAVTGKYKILQQKTMNNATRKLHQRFKDEETKDTKGQHFVVEADIKEFTQLKVDKRFQGILNMLRHCQRLRELRGGGITRYVLL
ncbi:spindle and kinetochore-associated protein 1 isoform X2 [Osmerus eperlanus]